MEEFIYVVLVGVAILLIVGALAGLPEFKGKESYNTTIFTEDLGMVGSSGQTFTDTYLGDISVGVTRYNRTLTTAEEYEIRNGVSSKKFFTYEFDAYDPQALYISFKVLETNLYAPLFIEINGNKSVITKVMEGVSPTFKLKPQKGRNVIRIGAESSGARFWAPTIYLLKNLKIDINDYGFSTYKKPLLIHDYEIRGFAYGELTFFIDKAVREKELLIKLNGRPLYNERPIISTVPYRVRFYSNTTGLHPGENTLEISTGEDSEYQLRAAVLKIFYYGEYERGTIKREFEMNTEDLNALKKREVQGVIELDSKIYLRGELQIELHNKTFNTFLTSGINRFYFDYKDVKEGKNPIILSTDGTYDIKLSVKLVDAS